jgi:hypothetical protein
MFMFCHGVMAIAEQLATETPATGTGSALTGSVHAVGLSSSAKQLADSLHITGDIEQLRGVPPESVGLASQVALSRMESRTNRRILAAYFELNDVLSKISDEMIAVADRQQALQLKKGGHGQLAGAVASMGTRAAGLAGGVASPMAMSGVVAGMVVSGVSSVSAYSLKKNPAPKPSSTEISPSMVAPLFPYAGTKPERYATFILSYLNMRPDGGKDSKRDLLVQSWKATSGKDPKATSTEEWMNVLGLKSPMVHLSSAELSKRESMLSDLRAALVAINSDLRELSEAF